MSAERMRGMIAASRNPERVSYIACPGETVYGGEHVTLVADNPALPVQSMTVAIGESILIPHNYCAVLNHLYGVSIVADGLRLTRISAPGFDSGNGEWRT